MNLNVENYFKAKKELDDHNASIRQLDDKQDILNNRLLELAAEIPAAEQRKKEAVDKFLLDEHSQADVSEASDQLERLRGEEKLTRELLDRIKEKVSGS